MAMQIFSIDTAKIKKLSSGLKKQGDTAFKKVAGIARAGLEELKRRVQRVSPVETGAMRQSWQVQFQVTGKKIEGAMGTSIRSKSGSPYPVYLEFGTARIAGGRVKQWKDGDAPIMDWPAKTGKLPNFFREKDRRAMRGGKRKVVEFGVGKAGSVKFQRAVQTATKAMTQGQGEQMPMIRPIANELMPKVLEKMIEAVQTGFSK